MEPESNFLGITRKDEEEKLAEVIAIAQEKIRATQASVQSLQNELNELRDVYDLDEKEGLALWFNTDARFQEVRKELLRVERSRKKPYFGRIDFIDDEEGKKESYYIGKIAISETPEKPIVIDWRAPVASSYYEQSLGKCTYKVPGEGNRSLDLIRKRTYEIEEDRLKDFYDTEVVANDDLLTKYLSKGKRSVLSEIIATIQQEQNDVIRKNPHHNILIQGSAGSGKTTVAMHRISYILYNYETEFAPKDFYIIGSNKVLLSYITGVLPDLDVYDVRQMTMEDLFVRLLYEQWDCNRYSVKKLNPADTASYIKGSSAWFDSLSEYATRILRNSFHREDVVLDTNGRLIMSAKEINDILDRMKGQTFLQISEKLNDVLVSKLESELFGRYYSYSKEKQKQIMFHYRTYFTRLNIKEDVVTLYEQFLNLLRANGLQFSYTAEEFDLYDLASMAYLYKCLLETEEVREASHIIIDEAQDFGIAVYHSLKYCLNKCTYTIMGDVSQNIFFGCGLSDWEELKKLMLPDPYDYFGLLKKSYRNTIEISEFATDILRHGTFPIYPVEPIIRHGGKVTVTKALNKTDLSKKIVSKIHELTDLAGESYETIAVICRNEEECNQMAEKLSASFDVHIFSQENTDFESGITVLPIEYAKGLEFDAVIICDASTTNYPYEDGYAKLLYVAATRALHSLTVFYTGKLTELLSTPVPADRTEINFVTDDYHKIARVFEEDTRTKKEIAYDLARSGDEEMSRRERFGPKRIVVADNSSEKKSASTSSGQSQTSVYKPYSGHNVKLQARKKGSSYDINAVNAAIMGTNVSAGRTASHTAPNSPAKKSGNCEFGKMPAGTSLIPAGHGKIDLSVRFCSIEKSKVTITSSYGTLYIIPISGGEIKVIFSKTAIIDAGSFPPCTKDKWTAKDLRDAIEITTEKLLIRIPKKSGALQFLTVKGQLLLSEADINARHYSDTDQAYWNYIKFDKKEVLQAYDSVKKEWIGVSGNAKYISCSKTDNGEDTILMSMKGYQIIIPHKYCILLCDTLSGAPYIKYEDTSVMEYSFRIR